MSAAPPRILLIDGDPKSTATTVAALGEAAHVDVVVEADGTEGFARAEAEDFAAVITEYRLEGMGGMELLRELHAAKPRLPIVMVTEAGDSGRAISAIKAGAYDYLTKPIDPDELASAVSDAIAASRRASVPVSVARGRGSSDLPDVMIGQSRAMLEVYKELARISSTPATVLIRGETGTGKELIARALFQHGHRAHASLITVNCAAIPENLLESELFGHEKGAFTGAASMRVGKFEQAHNATLFLDEIGDMDLPLQAKLLRVLQEKRIQRVGGNEDIPVDPRIIAATHRNLEEMIAAGDFRADLFYRLNVATIEIPPLRDRDGDAQILLDHFLACYAEEYGIGSPSITKGAIAYLTAYHWPGNVRQLQNVARKALLKCGGFAIDRDLVEGIVLESEAAVDPAAAGEAPGAGLDQLVGQVLARSEAAGSGDAYREAIEEVERALLESAMKRTGGNQAKAARWLGLSRFTLREKLRLYGLHPKG